MQKNIVILCGTSSLEHAVSLRSAYFVAKELNTLKCYNLLYIAITKAGVWKYADTIDALIKDADSVDTVHIDEGCSNVFQIGYGKINHSKIDCVFLTTHGALGEDGHIQGFLTIHGIPYSGCGLAASSACFNKNLCKYIAEANGIKTVPYVCLHRASYNRSTLIEQVSHLGDALVVKINRGGSSIGVFMCDPTTLLDTVEKAFAMDTILLIEKYLPVRELSVAALGNKGALEMSDIGEVELGLGNIYDFQTKYDSKSASYTDLNTAPVISDAIGTQIRAAATVLWEALELQGFARIDFFLHDGVLYLNEINTLPGMSSTSAFYVKLFSSKFAPHALFAAIINSSL